MTLFAPHRALGLVSTDTPFVLLTRGSESFVTTSVGRAFHVYGCAHLSLLFVSPLVHEPITCIVARNNDHFVAAGVVVWRFRRAAVVGRLEGHEGHVSHLLLLGHHLISVGSDGMRVWDAEGDASVQVAHIPLLAHRVTALMHPDTYLNKVVVGYENGLIQLINVRSSKVVYTFDGSMWQGLSCIVQSPVVDVVGVGTKDGQVVLHNLRTDKTVLSFRIQDGGVTSMAFRTDGPPQLVVATTFGSLFVWDLETQRLLSQMLDAHSASIAAASFLPSQPILITSSEDNSLKEWLFDAVGGRVLRVRDGHSAPPGQMCFYSDDGKRLLTSGADRSLRFMSTVKDAQGKELSQRSGKKISRPRLPPVTAMACDDVRGHHWDDIVTCHENSSDARIWRLQNGSLNKRVLKKPLQSTATSARSVAISACGSFAIIGYSDGGMNKFNIQSTLHRGSFDGDTKGNGGGTKSVEGVVCDAFNRVVVSGSLDCKLRWWNFRSHLLEFTVDTDSPVSRMKLHRGAGLIAVACDDTRIRLYDLTLRRLVRLFIGHKHRITDMSFSSDGRWLISSSLDCTVRVWDVPSGRLVDWFRVDDAVTSLAISPTSDSLVTTHVDRLGVYMWLNRSLFTDVPLQPITATGSSPPHGEAPRLSLPTSGGHREDEDEDEGVDELPEVAEEEEPDHKIRQIDPSLVTLSGLPESRWKTLTSLETIKARNRPIEPPAKPAQAPFFLPTLPGLEPSFAPETMQHEHSSRIVSFDKIQPLSRFALLLRQGYEKLDFSALVEFAQTLSPSAIDFELRQLRYGSNESDGDDPSGADDEVGMALVFLTTELATNQSFELLQAWAHVVIQSHGEQIGKMRHLQKMGSVLNDRMKASWLRVEKLFHRSLALVEHVSFALCGVIFFQVGNITE